MIHSPGPFLAGSESANSLIGAQRPLSIFSTSSTESSTGYIALPPSDERAHTLPQPSRINRMEVKKEVDMRLKTGIHHFNRYIRVS